MISIGKKNITMSPARQVVENLRTFEARTGRKLTPNQRWVLECCERQAGMLPASDPAADAMPDERVAELKEKLARRVAEYAARNGIDT